jgi:hypothetical protein
MFRHLMYSFSRKNAEAMPISSAYVTRAAQPKVHAKLGTQPADETDQHGRLQRWRNGLYFKPRKCMQL